MFQIPYRVYQSSPCYLFIFTLPRNVISYIGYLRKYVQCITQVPNTGQFKSTYCSVCSGQYKLVLFQSYGKISLVWIENTYILCYKNCLAHRSINSKYSRTNCEMTGTTAHAFNHLSIMIYNEKQKIKHFFKGNQWWTLQLIP